MSHYALVERSKLVVEETETLAEISRNSVRDDVAALYTSYAKQYPNPRLAEERNERDRLLEQVENDREKKRVENDTSKSGGNGGFGRFFRFWSGSKKDTVQPSEQIKDETKIDESLLIYSNIDDESSNPELCGTLGQLDYDCIPQEAHSAARFHLKSARSQKGRPVLVRPLHELSIWQTRAMCVVGIGQIAEFCEQGRNSPELVENSEDLVSITKATSDRDELIEYIGSLETFYDLNHVQAVSLGPNCLAISWGLPEGMIVMYRRIEIDGAESVGWESTGMFAPTEGTLHYLNSGGDLLVDGDNGEITSSLLRVTDIVPIAAENPLQSESGPSHGITLAVSRLGATIEFIQIVPHLWSGPLLTAKNYKRRPRKKRKRRGHEPPEHYCLGRLPNYSGENITVNAIDHHVDIMCLAVCRTSVSSDTVWDETMFPESPPAEHIIAACGSKEGAEHITFWAFSTIFETNPQVNQAGFSVHVSLKDAINTGSAGAGISVFGGEDIQRNWRKPRRVQLRPYSDDATPSPLSPPANSIQSVEADRHHVCTLISPAPIVHLSFGVKGGKYLLAVLDWNGGVAVVDCSRLIRAASHDLSAEEIKSLYSQQEVIPLCSPWLLRNEFVNFVKNSGHSNDPVVDLLFSDQKFPFRTASSSLRLAVLSQRGRIEILDLPGSLGKDSRLTSVFALKSRVKGPSVLLNTSEEEPLSFLAFRPEIKDEPQQVDTALNKTVIICSVRLLDVSSTIQSLAQSGNYREATHAAETLNICDRKDISDVIDFCQKKLWEQHHTVDYLKQVKDDIYVAEQVLSLWAPGNASIASLDSNIIIDASHVALKRISAAKEPVPSILQETEFQLKPLLLEFGTYAILCNGHGKTASIEDFHNLFRKVPLSQIAVSYAARGDIDALTLLFFRHLKELEESRLVVLGAIPVAVSPSTYCHLLPVYRSAGDGHGFFITSDDERNQLHCSNMEKHLQVSKRMTIFLDDDDNLLLRDRKEHMNFEVSESDNETRQYSLLDWYLTRAQSIEACTGNLSLLTEFCDYALKCLVEPFSANASNQDELRDETRAGLQIERLHVMRTSAQHLNRILTNDCLFTNSQDTQSSSIATINTSEYHKMSLPDRISMLLGEDVDPTTFISKYRTIVQPLIIDVSQVGNNYKEIDNAIVDYCYGLLNKAVTSVLDADFELQYRVKNIQHALSICNLIASSSNTSKRKADRLLKGKETLMKFILSVVYDAAKGLKACPISFEDSRRVINMMWELYQCLPKHLPIVEASEEQLRSLQEKADWLCSDLIALDLLSEWSDSELFGFMDQLRSASEVEVDGITADYSEADPPLEPRMIVGQKAVERMCKGYCDGIGSGQVEGNVSLFLALLSDIEQLNKFCHNGSLPISEILQNCICSSLLELEEFHLLETLLMKTESYWIDRKKFESNISNFVNEAIEGGRIQAAIRCQDVFGPKFPELQMEFKSMRQYLDAASFTRNVLLPGHNAPFMDPRSMRKKLPLDIVESVMVERPQTVLLGCSEWQNDEIAKQWNAEVYNYFVAATEGRKDIRTHPPLPGGAIFDLADMLGLRSPSLNLILRSRIAYHAIRADLHGASAAVCTSLVCDPALPWESQLDASVRLNAVAALVSAEDYSDKYTKKMLCQATLQRLRGPICEEDSASFDAIVRAYTILENETSYFQNIEKIAIQSGDQSSQRANASGHHKSDFLVFGAAGRVAKAAQNLVGTPGSSAMSASNQLHDRKSAFVHHFGKTYREIFEQYGADLHTLLLGLRQHATIGVSQQSESMLCTVCKLLLTWVITESVQLRDSKVQGDLEKSLTSEILALGTSLLLHLEDQTAGINLSHELLGSLQIEAASALESLSAAQSSNPSSPDTDIVSRLVGRGYSENGAKRAAVATNNESYQSALVWAVSHSLDPGFEDPIIVVKQETNTGFIDQALLVEVKEVLGAACRRLEAKEKRPQPEPAVVAPTKEPIDMNGVTKHDEGENKKGRSKLETNLTEPTMESSPSPRGAPKEQQRLKTDSQAVSSDNEMLLGEMVSAIPSSIGENSQVFFTEDVVDKSDQEEEMQMRNSDPNSKRSNDLPVAKLSQDKSNDSEECSAKYNECGSDNSNGLLHRNTTNSETTCSIRQQFVGGIVHGSPENMEENLPRSFREVVPDDLSGHQQRKESSNCHLSSSHALVNSSIPAKLEKATERILNDEKETAAQQRESKTTPGVERVENAGSGSGLVSTNYDKRQVTLEVSLNADTVYGKDGILPIGSPRCPPPPPPPPRHGPKSSLPNETKFSPAPPERVPAPRNVNRSSQVKTENNIQTLKQQVPAPTRELGYIAQPAQSTRNSSLPPTPPPPPPKGEHQPLATPSVDNVNKSIDAIMPSMVGSPEKASRYALRSRGSPMLNKLAQERREMTRVGSEERDRLLKEGRRLLEKAKISSTRRNLSSRALAGVSSSRYPLRSKTKLSSALQTNSHRESTKDTKKSSKGWDLDDDLDF